VLAHVDIVEREDTVSCGVFLHKLHLVAELLQTLDQKALRAVGLQAEEVIGA